MPGWHQKTKELQRQNKIQVVGIVEEQHADRTRLFMQWKQMRWPVMVDSLNLIGVSSVPITLLIDEYGIVRYIRPSDEEFAHFLDQEFRPRKLVTSEKFLINEAILLNELEAKASGGNAKELRAYGDALFLWTGPEDSSRAINFYQKALELDPNSGEVHFRLGVAYRSRYELESRESDDFLNAVKHWKQALEIDPNQYIWRRRIQQYGPRLDKPYSFYDWVLEARKDIEGRGEKPVQLAVEPGGAEFARPAKDFQVLSTDVKEPDPGATIHRDTEGMIEVETILVPHTSKGEATYRVHLMFQPAWKKRAHWNNEADNMEIWVSPPEGWSVDKNHIVFEVPRTAVSEERRKLEFELRGPVNPEGEITIPAYALYYVCEDVDGTCLYRRQDILIEVENQ